VDVLAWKAVEDQTLCDDGDPCTTPDSCSGGVCAAGPARDCDDSNECTEDTCDAGDLGADEDGCVHDAVAEGTACDAGGGPESGKCSAGECEADEDAPAAPVLTGTTPSSPSRSVVNPVVEGTAEAGTTVTIYTSADCTGTAAGEAVAMGGAFQIQVTVSANTSTTFHAKATDAAGNVSACSQSSVSYEHDSQKPAAPVIEGTRPASPSKSSTQPAVEGTTEANATVSLYTTAGCTGAVAASGAANGAGAFSLEVTVAEGSTTTFFGKATDAAGNEGACSAGGVTYEHQAASGCGDGTCDEGETAVSCADDCLVGGYAYVGPGEFLMGSPGDEPGRGSYEGPQRTVRITRGFWLKATEVTQGEWKAMLPEMGGTVNPSYFPSCGDECPVETVNWWESLAYCNALSSTAGLAECYTLTGCNTNKPGEDVECTGVTVNATDGNPLQCEGYRMPTEAEWEYAARAGSATAFYNGPITQTGCSPVDAQLDLIGWYAGNSTVSYEGGYDCSSWGCGLSSCGPQPVGRKNANDWGLRDMSGNVWEWAWDWYKSDYYQDRVDALSGAKDDDPLGPLSGSYRVLRGGSWGISARYCRSAYRDRDAPGYRSNNLGLRPARSAIP